ncbi:MAG: T9SS type A sorting domain-containing protein [Saprospiraceae bacterium]|nr:T9SS type A sorting domain-containing protein [Saprospiraceae bacterium]
MKYLYIPFIFYLFICHSQTGSATSPVGNFAPDWTLTDLKGNIYNLHSILNSGKNVVIQFTASWCESCWEYHQSQKLQQIWEQFGPEGTDEIMVFLIEADMTTNLNCLNGKDGCVGGTLGNWVANVSYPIIELDENNGFDLPGLYNVIGYPSLFALDSGLKKIVFKGHPESKNWMPMLSLHSDILVGKKTQNDKDVALINTEIADEIITEKTRTPESKTSQTSKSKKSVKKSNKVAIEVFNIFPNPAASQVNIELGLRDNAKATMSIYNSVGVPFSSTELSGSATQILDISGMENGIYYVNINNSEFSIFKKFIVLN